MKVENYTEYLKSEHWAKIKKKVRRLYRSCVLCDSTQNLYVHHRTYKNLGKENIYTDVTLICKQCSDYFHFERKEKDFIQSQSLQSLSQKELKNRRNQLRSSKRKINIIGWCMDCDAEINQRNRIKKCPECDSLNIFDFTDRNEDSIVKFAYKWRYQNFGTTLIDY